MSEFRFDHFVVNVNREVQANKKYITEIRESGFPYEPTWGKGTSGFKVSNLWIGNEYFEMVNIIKSSGGGWKSDWVEKYNNGHRGLICLMLDVANIEDLYEELVKKSISITRPEFLKFKWFFNMLTRTMPWKNAYLDFFEGIPLQIGFQQMKDDESRKFMEAYMVPNSRDNKIYGINRIVIKGNLTKGDEELLKTVFSKYVMVESPITIKFNERNILVFENDSTYSVEIETSCMDEKYLGKSIRIENISVTNIEIRGC